MGHTPGPWSFDGDYVESLALLKPLSVATLADCGHSTEENGNLIAAAPELLDGLKATVESLVELAQYEEAAQDMVATGWFDQAVKAIAKAEGRSG